MNSFSLEANGEILNDNETLESDSLVLVDKLPDWQYFNGNDAENDDVVLKRANGLIRQDKKDSKKKSFSNLNILMMMNLNFLFQKCYG